MAKFQHETCGYDCERCSLLRFCYDDPSIGYEEQTARITTENYGQIRVHERMLTEMQLIDPNHITSYPKPTTGGKKQEITKKLKADKKRSIMASHREQEKWVYVRVPRLTTSRVKPLHCLTTDNTIFKYDDNAGMGARVISSRKVEDAVEQYEYLNRAYDEGMSMARGSGGGGGWVASRGFASVRGATVREAYFRCIAEQERIESTPRGW